MAKIFKTIACSFAFLFLYASSALAQILYGATGSNGIAGSLYTINTATGASTLVAAITNANGGGAIGITGLAFNPVNSLLYGITTNNTPNGGNTVQGSLVTINTTTGVATVIGALGFANSDISFRSDGTLFGYEAGNSKGFLSMSTINLTTGTATRIGNSGLSSTLGGGLAFNSVGELYLSATGSSGTLDTLDPNTGARTAGPGLSGGPFSPAGGPSGALNAMAFDSLGVLYALDSNRGGPALVHLVVIDPITGTITDLGSVADNMDALAFAPVPEPSSVALGAIGVLVLAGLLWRKRARA
ncbi:MAG: PEP-CTERM sorting domain-containing protein [Chthoniobacterales bacterium]